MGYIIFRKGSHLFGASKTVKGAFADARPYLRRDNDPTPISIFSSVDFGINPFWENIGMPENAHTGALILAPATDRLVEHIQEGGMGNDTHYYYNEEREMYDTRPTG